MAQLQNVGVSMGRREVQAKNEQGKDSASRTGHAPDVCGARWSQFFELSLDMLAVASLRDGYFKCVNPAMLRTLGFSEAELLARPFMSWVHPEDLAFSEAAVRSLAAGHSLLDFEHRVPCKDGSYRWVAWHTVSQPEEGLIYCVGRDVTGRRSADAERAESFARERAAQAAAVSEHVRARDAAEATTAELEAILQSLPDAVYVGDASGIRRANERALTMLGYDSVADLNRNIGTLAAEIETRRADTGAIIPPEEQAFAQALCGKVNVQEVRVRHLKTGEERVLRSACAPVRVAGQVVAAVAINSDITEHKRAETAVRERAEFEQQLIGIVSHDLRNPLYAILLGVDSLLSRQELNEGAKVTLARIRSSVKRATRMINDLLDLTLARLGSGIPVHPQPLDLHAFTRKIVDEVLANFPGRVMRVEAEGDGRGTWDPDRLDQVLTNLASNALKYSASNTPVRVCVLGGDAVSVVITVHNQGQPIPPEALRRLFEPLQRASSQPDAAGRSVGLGLFIVRHVVEAHAGSVAVESSAGAGTTFTVRLPRTPPHARRSEPG